MSDSKTSTGSQPARTRALLDPDDSVLLLLDHQAGLFQTVKDISIAELRANTIMLARLSALLNIPLITSASVPDGPNGPLMPEIASAPNATFVPRKGEINAWDNEDLVRTVRATGRDTLIIAGVWTSVCVAFPALDAKAAGLQGLRRARCLRRSERVHVEDHHGSPRPGRHRPDERQAVMCEFQRHWNRPNNDEFAALYVQVAPNYGAVIESFQRAQQAALKSQLATA